MTDVHIDEHLETIDWGKQQDDGSVLLSPAWEVFILAVSIISVLNLLQLWNIQNPDIDQVVVIMDSILTVVFASDLIRRLVVADDRMAYLTRGWGWVDVLATFPLLRILRILRIARVLMVMRRFGGPWQAFRAFFSNKAAGGLLIVLLIAILVMEWGALLVLAVERGQEGANIENAEDAIWYLLVTMSTVGYGDHFPVTDLGRIIGSVIIVVGVGVFGTLTGFLANFFLAPSEATAAVDAPAAEQLPFGEPDEEPTDEDEGDEDGSGGAEPAPQAGT